MGNVNKVFLMGNLTRDPEMNTTPGGNSVTKFGVAINRRYTSNGEKREETTFVDIESWGKQAELINQHFSKGQPIFIEGRLKFDSWETKEGEKRSKLLVVLDNFQFISSGGEGDGNAKAGEENATPEPAPAGTDDVF